MKWNVSGCSDLVELLALRAVTARTAAQRFCHGDDCRGLGRPLWRGRSSRSARTATTSMTTTPTATAPGNHNAKSLV
jgi:hypothetical protein